MSRAIYPGSFDPVTLGHLDIIKRSAAIFDEVVVGILNNPQKSPLFSVEERVKILEEVTADLPNVTIDCFSGMLVDYAKANNINVVVHIINGLPYETKDMMIETVKFLNKIGIDGIKIHMLHILKDTKLAKMYEEEKFHVLTKEEYIDIVINQLEYLNENIVIHRITGDPDTKDLITPDWLTKK